MFTQTVHLFYAEINSLQMNRYELQRDPHHLEVSLGAPKTISEPMVCSMQTLHLSCDEINIVSKRTETCFNVTHVT
jgi:hypothetical protein